MRKGVWRASACMGALLLAGMVGIRLVREARNPPVPRPGSVEVFGPNNASLTRLEVKQRVAREVVAGRLTLLQAAASFKALDTQIRPSPEWTPSLPDASSEEEAYCLMVIRWAEGEAPQGHAADVGGPLRAEMASRLRDGTLHLPDADGACTSTEDVPGGSAAPDSALRPWPEQAW